MYLVPFLKRFRNIFRSVTPLAFGNEVRACIKNCIIFFAFFDANFTNKFRRIYTLPFWAT